MTSSVLLVAICLACLVSQSISFPFQLTRMNKGVSSTASSTNSHRPVKISSQDYNGDQHMRKRRRVSNYFSTCLHCSPSSSDGDGDIDSSGGGLKENGSDEVKQRRLNELAEKKKEEKRKLELSIAQNERARKLYEESMKLREEAKIMEEKAQSSQEPLRTMFEAPDRDIPKVSYGKNADATADSETEGISGDADISSSPKPEESSTSTSFPASSATLGSLIDYKKTRDEAKVKSKTGSVLTNRFEDAKETKNTLSKVSGETIRRALQDAEIKRLQEESEEGEIITENVVDLSVIEEQYDKIIDELNAIGVQGEIEIRVVNDTVVQKFVQELCNTSITEFPPLEEAYNEFPNWTIGFFRWIARNVYAQDDDADEEIIQLAFALQVQALSTDESGDWSMMRFEENFASVVEDIKKRKELNRLIEEAIKWQSVLQIDGSVGEGYSKEEYEQFLEDAKTFYIEEGGIPEDLADSPWVNIENVARDRDTITIDEAGAVKDDGWIIKDMDKSSEDKNDFLSGMFSVMDFDESLNDLNETLAAVIAEENEQPESLAERVISTGFDPLSINSGISLSRAGAGRFQEEVLNSIFRVNTVKMYKGCVIYEGTFNQKESSRFVQDVLDRLEKNEMSEEVDVLVLKNERYPTLSEGQKLDISKLALDEILTGSPPTVIAYPKSWNTTAAVDLETDVGKFWRNALTAGSYLASGVFAFGCYGGNDGTTLPENIPDDFVNLALAPILIASVSMMVETFVGTQKGIKIKSILLPTLTVGTFGQRSTYISPFKNRNDLFDTAAIGIFMPLVLSFGLMYLGFTMGASDPKEVVVNYPSIALSLLNTNSIVAEAINSQYPGIFDALSQDAATTVRMHWMVIAGAISFIGSTLQLLPVDFSAGSKMSLAIFGLENYTVASIFIGFLKFLFLLPVLFTDLGSLPLDSNRLLVDFLLCSQLATNPDTQQAVDNLSDVSEGRKILYAGFVFLVVLSFIPSMDIGNTFNSSSDYLLGVLKGTNNIDWSSLFNYNPPPGLDSL